MPRSFNYARIENDGEYIGTMSGSIFKIFEVPYREEFNIKGIQTDRESKEVTVEGAEEVNAAFRIS